MEIISICSFIYFLSTVNCYSDSESAESNRIEVTPFYDTIIYSDIADIINDFENKGLSPLNIFTNSESESDEKVEDLLTEYQHYLERAHKQRKNYLEKTKIKNKVPLLRHDQYSKPKPGLTFKNNDYYYSNGFYNPDTFKFPQTTFNNPLDVFIPLNSKGKYFNQPEVSTVTPTVSLANVFPFEKVVFKDTKILDLPPVMQKKSHFDPVQSSCFCKKGRVPCDCDCKQCLIQIEPFSGEPQMKMHAPEEKKTVHSSLLGNDQSHMKELNDNTLNIRIKVDLQLPKLQEHFGKYNNHNHNRASEPEDIISKELTTAIKLPFPYFNLPAPMELFSYKKPLKGRMPERIRSLQNGSILVDFGNTSLKYNKDDSIHKITIHKKKKSRTNNNNKKHRKKIITFHNINLGQDLFPLHFYDNITAPFKNVSKINNVNITTEASNVSAVEINFINNKTDEFINETHSIENLNLITNLPNDTYSTTEDSRKSENSIETDFTKTSSNGTTNLPTIREKRETNKKSDKNLLTDAELLYWPIVARNETPVAKKNITSIILENEHKKTKLNMSKETLRQNHTKVLEQAIFGDVDWDDIDSVAPAFMSFVGKYVRGILTFCSQQVCHSMKCADKTCLHRVCAPADRLNNKGHCAGSKVTDSVASMESIMDLPSNIVFEVVDILQNKMLGKIFGKATFCINSKCITLTASKKTFMKSRCINKELDATGHCSNVKTAKIM